MINSSTYKSLIFHSIFSYPLTEWEANKNSWSGEKKVLDSFTDQIAFTQGLYFIKSQPLDLQKRHNNYLSSIAKMHLAIRVARWLRLLPSVRLIAVCNSLGYLNAASGSDIDLFIITSPNRIWLTRFWLQSFLKIRRLRPYDRGGKQDMICLTFFLTTDSLNIANLKINQDDVYLTYWLTKLLPIYNPDKLYEKFFLSNDWLQKNLPLAQPIDLVGPWVIRRTFFSRLFSWLTWRVWEQPLKKIQLKLLPDNLQQLANQDSRVMLTDEVLKFHGQADKREYYQKLWEERCIKEYSIKY